MSNTIIWTAGVAPSPVARWLQTESDVAAGCAFIRTLASAVTPTFSWLVKPDSLDQDGKPLSGMAQVAIQQGRCVGRMIARCLASKPAPRPFRYFDKSTLAVVGKGFAVRRAAMSTSVVSGVARMGGASGIPGAV